MREWTLLHVWAALQRASSDLDVAAVSRDQYRSWRKRQPDPETWPALNTCDRVLLDYGMQAFSQPSGRDRPSDMEWSRHTCVEALAESGAETVIGYKTWRSQLDDPTSRPAWTVVNRKLGGWEKAQDAVAARS